MFHHPDSNVRHRRRHLAQRSPAGSHPDSRTASRRGGHTDKQARDHGSAFVMAAEGLDAFVAYEAPAIVFT